MRAANRGAALIAMVLCWSGMGCGRTTSQTDPHTRAPSDRPPTKRSAQQNPALSLETIRARIRAAPLTALAAQNDAAVIATSDLAQVRQLLFAKYRAEMAADAVRSNEFRTRTIRLDGHEMRYTATTVGEAPASGHALFIALHGGGGGPAAMNDSQWRHMQRYYLSSVKRGVYVAPRGITNTWNLHFRPQSYAMYERLIENFIALGKVDPNRVYLLGFSAGGDGVYQITPRTADRWAAANMSAGHPNGVSLENLSHVPFAVQVGERDAAYKRNTVAAQYCGKLRALRQAHPGQYQHACFIHAHRGHNFPDNDPTERTVEVLRDPAAWVNSGQRAVRRVDPNAVRWLHRHTRNPLPTSLRWDLRTRAPQRTGRSNRAHLVPAHRLFYWLALGHDEPSAPHLGASFDRATNTIRITAPGEHLRARVSETMLDLGRPITVTLAGRNWSIAPRPTLAVMARTLLERGDPHFTFPVEIEVLKSANGDWRVRSSGAKR